jgi:hypothetical protein
MSLRTRIVFRALTLAGLATAALLVSLASAANVDQVNPWPGDLSPAGLRAAASQSDDHSQFEAYLPEGAVEAAQEFVRETRAMGLVRRAGILYLLGPPNVQANNTAGDAIGESQSEVAVCVFRDTVVIGWNDARGFTAGNTISSYAYSTDGGATFTDGGNMPLAAAGDQAYGDPGIDTDERGNWYYNQIYTRSAPVQQNIGVHNGTFTAGVLTWNTPTMASIGTSATGNLDKCFVAADRVTGYVYDAYTRFTATPQIEIVRSTDNGATWGAPIVLDNTVVPTSSKQSARPMCGPGGEVYVVWEKGANYILCPDGSGNVVNGTAQIAFTRSLNNGASYDPFSIIGTVEHSWMWSGPGDLRERANEFPDIAVDVSGGCYRGRIYVTWHESAPWTANFSAGPARAEANDAGNNNPGGAELFVVGEDVSGSMSGTSDFDYWTFNAVQGTTYIFDCDPQGFVCGVSGTAKGMRMRLFATQNPYPNPTGFPDSLLAASALGAFKQRIVWTAPQTAAYLIRLQRSSGTTPFTYSLKGRVVSWGAPSPGRDARDVVEVHSSDQGATWTAEQRINDSPFGIEDRRPFIATNNLGHVTAYWHDSRDPGFGSNASLTSIYGTLSRDGGATWSPNFPVTDELSFFSFNTLGVPNLGDYNQAHAGQTAVFHPAWSDQRLSTGDVRTPGTNTYTAGTGPNAVTTRIEFSATIACPPDTMGQPGGSVVRKFRITNTGTAPDQYTYTVTSSAGWGGAGPANTPVIAAGSFFDVFVTFNIPTDCNPPVDNITFTVQPLGEACLNPLVCQTHLYCDIATATLVSRFDARLAAAGVDLSWSSDAVGQVEGWNVYRTESEDGAWARLNSEPIAMGAGGEFRFHDGAAPAGDVFYRLTALMPGGREEAVTSTRVAVGGRPFEFAIAGRNPFAGSTTLRYALPRAEHVRIDVYSVSGQRLRTLVDRTEAAGVHTVDFALRGEGRGLTPGMYLIRITAASGGRTLRVVGLD